MVFLGPRRAREDAKMCVQKTASFRQKKEICKNVIEIYKNIPEIFKHVQTYTNICKQTANMRQHRKTKCNQTAKQLQNNANKLQQRAT